MKHKKAKSLEDKISSLHTGIIILSAICIYMFIYILIHDIIPKSRNFKINDIVESFDTLEAPNDGSVGLWKGHGNINDNESDYYIVHDFSPKYGNYVLNAQIGDIFSIKDNDYKIYDIFFMEQETPFEQIESRVLPGGDTAAIQVCEPGTNWVKIIIARTGGD